MRKIKRIVDTGFWSDDKVLDFSPEDKYFMLFLLTNEYTTQLGVYHLPIKKASADLGYSQDSVKVLLERFENKYKIIKYSPETNEVAIINYLLYSIVSGGKPVLDCLLKEMDSVKDTSLLKAVYNNLSRKPVKNETVQKFIELLKEYLKENDNDNDNDNERIVDESLTNRILSDKQKKQLADNMTPITLDVVTYLNEKANTNFKPCTDKTKRCIKARVNEGFTLEDFKKVIDKKVNEWMGTEFQQYLRPETLFGTKFEGYLNAKEVKPKGNKFNQMIKSNYDFDAIEEEILK